MHRPAQLWQKPFDDDAIQVTQDQPFGAAGCSGNGTDALLRKTAVLDVLVGSGPGLEEQRMRFQLGDSNMIPV